MAICSIPSPHFKMFWNCTTISSWSGWHWKLPAPIPNSVHDPMFRVLRPLVALLLDRWRMTHLPALETRRWPPCGLPCTSVYSPARRCTVGAPGKGTAETPRWGEGLPRRGPRKAAFWLCGESRKEWSGRSPRRRRGRSGAEFLPARASIASGYTPPALAGAMPRHPPTP